MPLTAPHGYVKLGMFLDANAELDEVDADVRHLPEVLGVRIEIYRALKKWELMEAVARKLTLTTRIMPNGGSHGPTPAEGLNPLRPPEGFC